MVMMIFLAKNNTWSVQTQDGLDGNVEGRTVESFEHNLGHFLSVPFRVHGGFGQEARMLVGDDSELIIEAVVPDFFHVIPIGDDSVFDGVFQGQDSSLGLGLVSDETVLLKI